MRGETIWQSDLLSKEIQYWELPPMRAEVTILVLENGPQIVARPRHLKHASEPQAVAHTRTLPRQAPLPVLPRRAKPPAPFKQRASKTGMGTPSMPTTNATWQRSMAHALHAPGCARATSRSMDSTKADGSRIRPLSTRWFNTCKGIRALVTSACRESPEREEKPMIYEIEPNSEIDPDKQPHAYKREIQRIAGLVKQHVNFQGMPHAVEEDGCMIWVTTLVPLLEEQKAWLRTAPEIHGFCPHAVGGGQLTFEQKRPTTQIYPCVFTAPTDQTTRLERILVLDGLTSHLHVRGGKGITVATDQELLELLQRASLPLDGWRQTVWLCRRCGQPGAHDTQSMCAACEAACRMFMEIPFQTGLEHTGRFTSAQAGRFHAEYDHTDQELRLSWPGAQVFCSLTDSQSILRFLLAVLPFEGQQNEALWQMRDLQATYHLIENVSPAYRIEQESNQIVLIQQDKDRHALAAWVLPEGDRERAVKAVLAAEGDYSPQTEGERLALQVLFNTLEAPEDED